jgi:hypothetical protein
MKESEFSGRYEIEIRPSGWATCWLEVYKLDIEGNRMYRVGYEYCMTKFTARIWARWIIHKDLIPPKERKKTFVIDVNKKPKKERRSWFSK